jgi:hypothetical protein
MMQKAPPAMGSSSASKPDTRLLPIPPPVQIPQAFVASTRFEQGPAKAAPPMKSRRKRRGVLNRTSLLDDSSNGGISVWRRTCSRLRLERLQLEHPTTKRTALPGVIVISRSASRLQGCLRAACSSGAPNGQRGRAARDTSRRCDGAGATWSSRRLAAQRAERGQRAQEPRLRSQHVGRFDPRCLAEDRRQNECFRRVSSIRPSRWPTASSRRWATANRVPRWWRRRRKIASVPSRCS